MRDAVVAFLVWLSSDPQAIDAEAPRAAAAVAAARASMAVDTTPPAPKPKPGECCTDCGGKGYIVHGDGHRTACPCPSSCKCKSGTKPACPNGKCPTVVQ
jgi:hypothetical protein